MTVDWFEILNIERALQNFTTDVIGDWYRDPWGWPEVRWVVSGERPEYITPRLNDEGVKRHAVIDIPKTNFGIRPAVVLDPLDRLAYQALVDRSSKQLHSDLPIWVYGWRVPPVDNPRAGYYSNNGKQWRLYRGRLTYLAERYDYALQTDVVSFFASVDVALMEDLLVERTGSGAVTDRILSLLRAWDDMPARSGLPQRSFASAVLANAFLRAVDDCLERFGGVLRADTGSTAVRWMDDMWLFGNDRAQLRAAQLQLTEVMRSIGLNLNAAKTDVIGHPELLELVREHEHRGLDYLLETATVEATQNLDALIEKTCSRPEHANRTDVKYATVRMRDHGLFDGVPAFVEVADRMPHCADALSRLFRDSGMWSNLSDWFLEYADSPWGTVEWSVAQVALMFPASWDEPAQEVVELFLKWVQSDCSLPLMAVASQRLAAWQPEAARYAFRERLPHAENPLERRVLGLGGLEADAERSFVRTALNEFEENRVTLDMLEEEGWNAPSVSKDFTGDS